MAARRGARSGRLSRGREPRGEQIDGPHARETAAATGAWASAEGEVGCMHTLHNVLARTATPTRALRAVGFVLCVRVAFY